MSFQWRGSQRWSLHSRKKAMVYLWPILRLDEWPPTWTGWCWYLWSHTSACTWKSLVMANIPSLGKQEARWAHLYAGVWTAEEDKSHLAGCVWQMSGAQEVAPDAGCKWLLSISAAHWVLAQWCQAVWRHVSSKSDKFCKLCIRWVDWCHKTVLHSRRFSRLEIFVKP